ncbi:hypothetical protein JCM19239_3986 [Vibrio variabilis]|uniref:Oligosaccharide repeat unit polymerase n=1 Tax=Vibrio variabilis TaxID=990271 RepID=A0ABQ0J671_9VIBR|nr:hypothetical protein JCM19239_3986 [Vibrio variabilis]
MYSTSVKVPESDKPESYKSRKNKPWSLKLWLPLILVQVYLVATILLAYFGPVNWNFEEPFQLVIMLASYQVACIVGYMLYAKRATRTEGKGTTCNVNLGSLVDKYFWVILFLASVGTLISFKNVTMSNTFEWSEYWSGFQLGLARPWEARALYAAKYLSGEYLGSKYLSMTLLFFSVFKYLLIPILVFRWPFLSWGKKIAGLLVATIPICSGVIMSLSAINFHYLFVISICLFAVYLSFESRSEIESGADCGFSGIKRRKFFLGSLVFLFAFSFWQFYAVKAEVSLYSSIGEEQQPSTFDYLRDYGVGFERDRDEYYGVGYDFYEKLTVYLTQGYKGVSLSLNEPFDSTYGVGHSLFLQRLFEDHLGFDIRSKTYQRKITEYWHENIFWHSAYSYFANDVSFYGVIVVMLLLGYYFSMVVHAALLDDNFIAKSLLPLFAIMFLYMPANNQVFSQLEYMSPFWVLTGAFVLLSSRKLNSLVRKSSFQS